MSAGRGDGSAGAVVIGADYKALGTVRSLGRHGVRVWVLHDAHQLARWSRYAERSLPWVPGNDVAQVQYLLAVARTYALDGWALFPSDDVRISATLPSVTSGLATCSWLSAPISSSACE